jgi:hypothetical protein
VTLSANNTASSTLSGAGSSDPEGSILKFNWVVSSGPAGGAVLNDANAENTSVNFNRAGTYLFRLTVTDDKGATGSAQASVTVNDRANLAPVAKAAATPSALTLSTNNLAISNLSGTGSSDPDGTIKTFNWVLSSGPSGAVVFKNANAENTQVSLSKTGTYVFTLTVTDDKGATGTATATVIVNDRVNQPPVAKATAVPSSILITTGQPATIILDSTGSTDPDGSIKSFLWTLTSGPGTVKIDLPTAAKTSALISVPGNYSFLLTVTDDGGSTGTASVPVVAIQEAIVAKTCSTLASVISDFDKLSGRDTADNFKLFGARYQILRIITQFYNLMKTTAVNSMSTDKQIDFFVTAKIDSQLPFWINGLIPAFQGNINMLLLSIHMLLIHTRLAYYIACIETEDVGIAKNRMLNSLNAIVEVLGLIRVPGISLNDPQKAALNDLLALTKQELQRVKDNGEASKKPQYVELLNKIS